MGWSDFVREHGWGNTSLDPGGSWAGLSLLGPGTGTFEGASGFTSALLTFVVIHGVSGTGFAVVALTTPTVARVLLHAWGLHAVSAYSSVVESTV